jgi:Holliday junction resolvase RusA-like endonuclease
VGREMIFKVPGIPRPWAKKEIARTKSGFVVYTRDKDKSKARWVEAIQVCARSSMGGGDSIFGAGVPVVLSCEFYLPKPKKPKYPYAVTVPDLDNLAYAVTNALKGVVYHDDCQVVQMTAVKIYAVGFEPHALIKVERLEEV